MLKKRLQDLQKKSEQSFSDTSNYSNKDETYDKEAQMQYWTDFVVNKVMPEVAKYDYVTESKYTFENSASIQHGNFSSQKLPQTEQLALLGVDYALSKGINPLPVILGCVATDFRQKYFDYYRDKTKQKHFSECAKKILDDHTLNITEQDKKPIIHASYFPNESGSEITDCINDAYQTRERLNGEQNAYTWAADRAKEVNSFSMDEKNKYLKQQLDRLNKADRPSYIQQSGIQRYSYTNSPLVGTAENPIVVYHSTPLNIAKLDTENSKTGHFTAHKIYFSPDIRYVLAHNRGNKNAKDTQQCTFVSINGSGQVERGFFYGYLHQQKKMTYKDIRKYLDEDNIQPSQKNNVQFSRREINTPAFVYKAELVGVFPLSDQSFEEQKIDLPMDRICRFMEIDYPIKDKKQFLKQSLKGIKNLQSFTPSTQDERNEIKKLEDFLTYVDIFDGKSSLQEQSRDDFIPTTEKILKTLIHRNSPQDFRLSPYRELDLLIDGMRECGYLANREAPPHYVVLNPEVIKINARYQLKGYEIVKIEKPNAEGHFGAITPHSDKQQLTEPLQQMVADIPQTSNQESNNATESNQQPSSVEPPKVTKNSQLSPELLAKNIHRYL